MRRCLVPPLSRDHRGLPAFAVTWLAILLLSCSPGVIGDVPDNLVEGTFEDRLCTPAAVRCHDEAVERCDDNGSWSVLDTCVVGEQCRDGECVPSCVANCAGRECGEDGCSGSCGDCSSGEMCTTDGHCQNLPPGCGDDQCGASESCADCPVDCGDCCGDGVCDVAYNETCVSCSDDCGCGSGEVCGATGVCECQPDCSQLECGLDPVCQQSCGDCGASKTCQQGRCVDVSCDDLPPLPVSYSTMTGMTTCEDFTFDTEGRLVGVTMNGGDLIRMTYSGAVELLIPDVGGGGGGGGMGWVRGTRFLPDGDLIIADPTVSSLVRVDLNGDVQTIRSGVSEPNGIAIGMDGFAYLATLAGKIYRVNPDNGDYSVLLSSNERYDGITFNADYTMLYFDEENEGEIHRLPIYSDGTAGQESTLATINGGGMMDLYDGMAADECGNAYVIKMSGEVYRVTPQGDVDLVVSVSTGGSFGGGIMALNFGTGVGGWGEDQLYVMGQGDRVYEVDIGVRGKWEPHLP
jgi:sugar lactone lactonase YvrE